MVLPEFKPVDGVKIATTEAEAKEQGGGRGRGRGSACGRGLSVRAHVGGAAQARRYDGLPVRTDCLNSEWVLNRPRCVL